MSTFDLSVLFFLQLAAVLIVCRAVCWIAGHFGQPPVVGEMIAGVCLGPSVLGFFWPHAQQMLFPPASRPILFSGAQIGLALYMFTVGLDFRIDLVRSRLRSALAISASGILVAFGLGWMLVCRMVAAWFASTIRRSAVCGACFLGAAVPRGDFATRLQALIEPLTTCLLLPLFCIYSGLNTRFDLVNDWFLWVVALVVL